MRIVHTPAGKCPFELKGTSEEEVLDWTEKLMAHARRNDSVYSTGALNYFAQQFYNLSSQEHKTISSIINNHYVRDDYETFMKGRVFSSGQTYLKNSY
jgi:hypothetical protein